MYFCCPQTPDGEGGEVPLTILFLISDTAKPHIKLSDWQAVELMENRKSQDPYLLLLEIRWKRWRETPCSLSDPRPRPAANILRLHTKSHPEVKMGKSFPARTRATQAANVAHPIGRKLTGLASTKRTRWCMLRQKNQDERMHLEAVNEAPPYASLSSTLTKYPRGASSYKYKQLKLILL
ncbi:hypothetical protein FHL15_004169 [Xylaria flabelliformis]|uniref:Uncharacterized protein n=1 Tax=Xylaria flabelliformis TaxID=2512241 RepID=A0A553I4F6_9PEZI|nr:hypothetical protein FHL15_004169 [Xylaria flabelliformis]